MELQLLNGQGQATGKVDVPETVFGRDYNESLIHQLLVAYQANARQGTRAQKDRSVVKHSTKKPFRQKGTGRARAGMTSSPLWRGGGKIFPSSSNENFSQKINKKMYRAAMASIYSQLAREDRLVVIDPIEMDAPSTKVLAKQLKEMQLSSVLFIVDDLDLTQFDLGDLSKADSNFKLFLSARNLPNVAVVEPRYADPVSLVFYKKVLVTKEALGKIKEMLA